MSRARQRAIDGLKVGDEFRVSRTFAAGEINSFGDITRDYNPVHFEPAWVAAKGFAGPILHGLLTASMVCEIGGQLAWLATGMNFRYLGPVYPGDTVTLTVTITQLDADGKAEASASYRNQRGELVLSGELFGRLPQGEEREILAEIIQGGDPSNKLADD